MSPKVWIITGTSSGFGRELVDVVLENGDIAVATLRCPETLSELTSKYPAYRLLVLKLDISVPQEVLDAFAAVKEKFGRLDVVVNNAGYGVCGEVESVNMDDIRNMFETNFWGTEHVTRQAVKFMREVNPKGAGGRILQVSSIAAVRGAPALTHYGASKSALEAFSEGFAAELDPEWNIKVSAAPSCNSTCDVVIAHFLQICIVNPGGFKTLGISKGYWPPVHPAYTKPTLPTVVMRNIWDTLELPGDARKGMETIYKLASLDDSPMHFPLGKDAVEIFKQKATHVLAEAEKYGSWSENLNRAPQ
ncbi:NAD(P)-binding protein [Daedaleopsis nitida]|nr:NAD(P)-binding protein [Daedaleopsis nitida]